MGLFSKRPAEEPLIRPEYDVSGRPQARPESADSSPRRQRLFVHAERTLHGHPLTGPRAFGLPLSDAHGVLELVAIIEPMYRTERSLLRWVALRGALASMSQLGPQAWDTFMECVGLEETERNGESIVTLRKGLSSGTAGEQNAAAGLHHSFMSRLVRYDEISAMSISDVNTARNFMSPGVINDAMALDYIVYAATVLLRMEGKGMIPSVLDQVPLPSRLDRPGWYVDPMFAKSHRYWDGRDWTSRMRVHMDGRTHYAEQPLRP